MISTKSLTGYDLSERRIRGIGIAYVKSAHP
jgi:hypothetical protein